VPQAVLTLLRARRRMTKTNVYLMKLAAKLKDEGDAAKAFAQTSAAGYAGHIGGLVAGSLGGALLASKSKRVQGLASKAVGAGERLAGRVKSTGIGKWVHKHVEGGGHGGLAGGIAGGIVGEEAAQYGTTRHNIMKTKQERK
jgi:hypothetical protein